MPTDFMKRLLEKGSAATLEYFAKAQIAGRDTGLRQVDWVYAIQKFADLTFPDKLTPQQRFSRALDTPEGMLLFKAMDAAPPPSYEPEPVEKEEPRHIGEHAARLHVEATARMRERACSYPAAVSEILTKDPKLAAAVRDEHLQHALSMSGAIPSGVGGNLSIRDAQNLGETEPTGGAKVRPFPASAYGASQARKSANSAEAALGALARAYQAEHPETKSYEIAFSKVILAPENRHLAKRAEAERLAALAVT